MTEVIIFRCDVTLSEITKIGDDKTESKWMTMLKRVRTLQILEETKNGKSKFGFKEDISDTIKTFFFLNLYQGFDVRILYS